MLFGPNLGPYITEWEQVLDAAFGDEGHYLEANVDVKLRGSFLEQAAATSTAVGGPWMARNEARSMRNMPPVEGGDELITPLNVLVGGQASPHDSGSQNTTPKTYALHLRETDPAASEPTTDDADNGDGPNPTGL